MRTLRCDRSTSRTRLRRYAIDVLFEEANDLAGAVANLLELLLSVPRRAAIGRGARARSRPFAWLWPRTRPAVGDRPCRHRTTDPGSDYIRATADVAAEQSRPDARALLEQAVKVWRRASRDQDQCRLEATISNSIDAVVIAAYALVLARLDAVPRSNLSTGQHSPPRGVPQGRRRTHLLAPRCSGPSFDIAAASNRPPAPMPLLALLASLLFDRSAGSRPVPRAAHPSSPTVQLHLSSRAFASVSASNDAARLNIDSGSSRAERASHLHLHAREQRRSVEAAASRQRVLQLRERAVVLAQDARVHLQAGTGPVRSNTSRHPRWSSGPGRAPAARTAARRTVVASNRPTANVSIPVVGPTRRRAARCRTRRGRSSPAARAPPLPDPALRTRAPGRCAKRGAATPRRTPPSR